MGGEAKIEDLSQQAQIDAAKKFNAAEAPQPSEMGGTGTTGAAAPQPAIPEDDEDEEVDEEGVEDKDIELVMSQANVSRSNARTSFAERVIGFRYHLSTAHTRRW